MIFAVTDLNCKYRVCDLAMDSIAGANHVHRQAGLRATHGTSPAAYLSPNRGALCRRTQSQNVFLPRSFSLHGLCATDLSRELARYRNVSASTAIQAVSPRYSLDGCTQ